MKKLVMAMAIALAAVQAQALYLSVEEFYSPGSGGVVASANAYFIYSDTLSPEDAVAAFCSAGASYESTIASSAARAKEGYIEDGSYGEFTDVSRFDEMYFLCFDQDNNYMYVSPAVPYNSEDEGSYDYNAGETSFPAAKAASDGYQGAGWYIAAASPVPEPTSGLLMLLGVAGLALKRKRA